MKNFVFIANNNVGSGLSGGDRIFLELLKNWQDKVRITILASQETIVLLNRYKIKNINVIVTDFKINDSNNLTIVDLLKHNFIRTLNGLKTVFKNKDVFKKADFIYSVSDFYPDLLPAFLGKIINNKTKWIAGYYLFAPNPFSKTNPYRGNLFLKGLFYWLMQIPSHLLVKIFADIVFVTSIPDTKKFPGKKVIVIRGGVDVGPSEKYFKRRIRVKNKYAAVFMGRFHPQKGVVELIDIWKIVTKKIPDARLALIGNGELENIIREKISKLKLNKNIELLGFLEGPKKYKIFQQSQIVVHPAVYDSGGMAAAEAMAWGLPGVSFNLEALKTYYPKGMLKTRCFDKNLFSQNIIKLLTNKKLHQNLSNEARNLILNKWNWGKRADEIYSDIIQ